MVMKIWKKTKIPQKENWTWQCEEVAVGLSVSSYRKNFLMVGMTDEDRPLNTLVYLLTIRLG